MKIGDRVYRHKDCGKDIVEISEIVGETKKYFKLKTGILIDKENGCERGSRDTIYPRYYFLITPQNEKNILASYKYSKVISLKLAIGNLVMNTMEYTPEQIDRLYLLFSEAKDIINSGKKIKE